jgi:hypothetical protein
MVCPSCGLFTHPADGRDYLDVRDFDGAMKDRLVMIRIKPPSACSRFPFRPTV